MRYDIFPTPVWHIEGTPQELVDELYQGAYRFKKKHPSTQKTNQGGYQTPTFEWKDFHPQGIEYIENVVGDMFKFKVESWWYNINGQGHWNIPHTHPNSDFALVLYLTDSDSLLTFLNPHAQRTISQQNSSINAKPPLHNGNTPACATCVPFGNFTIPIVSPAAVAPLPDV